MLETPTLMDGDSYSGVEIHILHLDTHYLEKPGIYFKKRTIIHYFIHIVNRKAYRTKGENILPYMVW
jgi:hypothetical protein